MIDRFRCVLVLVLAAVLLVACDLDDGNVISRYLLSKVLFEILSVEGERSKEQIRSHAMNEHGCVIMPKPDGWIDN